MPSYNLKPTSQTTADPVVLDAVREAWDSGYQTAVDTLRNLQYEANKEETRALIRNLADTLQDLKP